MTIVAPSLLSCNFLNIGSECAWLENTKAKWLHLDVMDGVFVPNISFGIPIVQAVRSVSSLWLDTHLMIIRPHQYIDAFHRAGTQSLSIHVEASVHLKDDLLAIRQLGMKAGIAINPDTPAEAIFDMLPYADMICVMSVYPGFGGQSFIPSVLKKIQTFRTFIDTQGLDVAIEVDGGVTLENAHGIKQAGANILVAGNTVFSSKNPAQAIEQLLND